VDARDKRGHDEIKSTTCRFNPMAFCASARMTSNIA
jgi:hypothetical protein